MSKFSYHKDGSKPNKYQVFVFGSNLAGLHGAGAAKLALKYGARMGHGVGLVGLTYAIPTKNYDIETMPIEQIKPYIDRFVRFTLEFPNVKFFVTRVGCGLAGYKDKQIALLFARCGSNCSFATEWKEFLE